MENFTWVRVYNKIAHKILEYKNKSKELAELMYRSLEDANLMYSEEKGANLDSNEGKRCRYTEIDPISFMNRFEMYNNKNRRKLIESFEKNTGMEIDIPKDFDGLPTTSPQMSSVIRFMDTREIDDIPNIWELFDIALTGDMEDDNDRNKFIEYYDKVISKPCASYNISIGLFKIRPDVFLNLDHVNRIYIEREYGIKITYCPRGKKYLSIVEYIKNQLDKSNESLLDFSYKAWKNKNNIKEKTLTKTYHGKEYSKNYNVMYGEEKMNNNRKYYWLNANPKIWSFSELKNGETIEYTAINENGNKRRIYRNYQNAKKGDMVIAYESTPIKAIVGICIIEEELKDNILKIKKLETLINPISYSDILNEKELSNMEYIQNPQGSLFALKEHEYNIIMDIIREANPINKKEAEPYNKKEFLKDVYMTETEYDKLVKLLFRKKNLILQGAPGVGKTYIAKRLAYSIIGSKDAERIKFIQFHQSYGYEDFVEGFRPTETLYKLEQGVFYNFCRQAENNPDLSYFFIIDEINRGNLSKIFGELLMLIENDKRGEKLTLPLSKIGFSVPENVYIIGMMNTADRSLALIDYALRRRFAFYKLKPAFKNEKFIEYKNKLKNHKFNKIIENIEMLNIEINNDLSLGEGFEIGHSYFCNFEQVSDEDIELIITYEILPLLEEYWFDDIDKYNEWKERLKGAING